MRLQVVEAKGQHALTWRPIHPSHAIERTRLIVSFTQGLPSKTIGWLGSELEDRRSQLGFNNRVDHQGTALQIGANGTIQNTPSNAISGWEFHKTVPGTNQVVEAFHVESSYLSFEVLNYQGWGDFIKRFEAVAQETLSAICRLVDMNSISLEYIDRFVFAGDPKTASPESLLPQISHSIGGAALAGEELWHVHRGWFEVVEGHKLLINQNLDCQEGNLAGQKPTKSIQILTKVDLREIPQQVDYIAVKPQIEMMHIKSKQVFGSVISEEMLTAIGAAE